MQRGAVLPPSSDGMSRRSVDEFEIVKASRDMDAKLD